MTTDAPPQVRHRLPRAFHLLLGSQGISMSGSDMQQIALPLWVFMVTGSALSTGLAFALQFVPIVLLAPWAGYIADRFDRRRLMLTCELLAAGVVSMTLLGVHIGSLPMVLAFASLTRIFNAFTMPAMQAIIVSVVPQEDRARSASQSTTMFAVVQMVAPLAGTGLAAAFGFPFVLLVDLISFLIAAMLLWPIPPVPGEPTLRHGARATWAAFRDHATTRMRWVLVAETAYFLLWGADTALALLILQESYGTAAAGMYSAAAGVGWVVGAALVARRFEGHPLGLMAGGAVCGLVGAGTFVALVGFGLLAAFPPGVVVGVGNLALVTGAAAVFLQEARSDVAGRLFAIRRASLNGMLTLSYLLLPGVSAGGLGNKATLILFSLLMPLAVLPLVAWTARHTRMRTAEPEPETGPQPEPEAGPETGPLHSEPSGAEA
jgi:MFS family permease